MRWRRFFGDVPNTRQVRESAGRSGPSLCLTPGMAIAQFMLMTLTLIAGTANPSLATSIAHALGIIPCRRTVHRFADGELHVEIDESVRGHDVTNSVETTSQPPAHFQVVNVAPLIADAIGRLHRDQTLEPMLAHV